MSKCYELDYWLLVATVEISLLGDIYIMGEIDTKPIEPVQVALTLFGEKGDPGKNLSSGGSGDEVEKEKDVETLLKHLANYKVQMEAKDFAFAQVLHTLEHYQKTTEELSALLKNSEVERDGYREDCREARTRINELEAKVKEMADKLLETGKIREKLSHVLSELRATQEEIISMETQLATAREVNLKAMKEAELMETAANMEKERAEKLANHVAELNEVILVSKLAAIEAEKEKCMVLSEKDARLESAMEKAEQAQEQEENMKKRLEMMQELENQLLAKSEVVDSLQGELNQAFELLSSSNKAVSDAVHDLNQLEADLKVKEGENSDQAFYIGALETELNQLKIELKNANEEASHLNCNVEILTDELQKVKIKMDGIKEREKDAQVEISLLKSEIERGRSEFAAAEARPGSVKSGFCLAVQQLAVEAEEAKKENQRLKGGVDKVTEESEDFGLMDTDQHEKYSCQAVETFKNNESNAESVRRRNENEGNITISLEEYESLISKAEKANEFPGRESSNMSITSENKCELEVLKKELESAIVKIGELRTRAEQAVTRAEAAEKAKTTLEDQLKRRREQKQRIKAAIVGLREESTSRGFSSSTYAIAPREYQTLGKVLNMKF
ncbi:unnamed protein product [Dovyalis caffra]|uniref:Uncharacterized protein n=1 Tax=Dovyalis caffra TaxID=77055 RepID=A0AAV1QR56_9ROSI|nr:unnamed protein product [Dovyalis caffra]